MALVSGVDRKLPDSAPVPDPPADPQGQLRSIHEAALVPAATEYMYYARVAVALLTEAGATDHISLECRLGASADIDQHVVVTPSTVDGLHHASAMIGAWRPDLPQPALLVMRDAPFPPPQDVVLHTHALAERVACSVEIPYMAGLRRVHDPVDLVKGRQGPAKRVRRALTKARSQLYVGTFFTAGQAITAQVPPRLSLEPAQDPPEAPVHTPDQS